MARAAGADTPIVAAALDPAPALTAAKPAPLFGKPALKGVVFVGLAFVTVTSMIGSDSAEGRCLIVGCGGPVPIENLPPHYGAVHH